MTNYELYIDGKLADVGPGFGVRLNRQLITPGELNTKDAQYSYSLTLPPTEINQAIFKYAIIEESRDKFNQKYTAQLAVNSVRIFVGNFRLSEINQAYKGNLYIPSLKSIKDIFGAKNLTQHAPLLLPFEDFVTSINFYNTQAANGPQAAIFPFVLYGLLAKVPLNSSSQTYSARNLWDSTVRIGISDLPPSVNPLIILRHIFNTNGYNLVGSAFDDVRIANLYQSYKNATDYIQPWNYGQHAKIQIHGRWNSQYNKRTGAVPREYERGVNRAYEEGFETYVCDLFDATNTQLIIDEDTGGNVSYKEVNDEDGVPWVRATMRIPSAGFYKVVLNSSLKVSTADNFRHTDSATGVQHLGGESDNRSNTMKEAIYEFKLMRDRKSADFGLANGKLGGTFYRNNLPQNVTFDEESIPKYFPKITANGQINFVDAAQDPKIVLGFAFGRREPKATLSGGNVTVIPSQYQNPKDTDELYAQVLAAKPALSWDTQADPDNPTRLAINATGYQKYGRIGTFDNPGDNPNIDLDYSASTREYGKVLNLNGNPVAPPAGNLGDRINGYYINPVNGFPVASAAWQTSAFIDLRNFNDILYNSVVIGGTEGAALVGYYDVNLQYLGSGYIQPAPSITDTYIDAAVTPPPAATFVKFSAQIAQTMTIEATDTTADNVILYRFPLARNYTYVITGGSGYTGTAYVHTVGGTFPVIEVDFVAGVAEFTVNTDIFAPPPVLTIYLKTAQYDVDGSLTISRQIDTDSQEVVGWEDTDKYEINLTGAPTNYAKRGQFEGAVANTNWNGQGAAAAVVWFEAGELLTLASISSEGAYRRDGMHSTYGWTGHEVSFDLSIQPFRIDPDWLKVNFSGNGTATMNWADAPNFQTDDIDLVKFLPADTRTDDYIEQFCKAFNLKLTQLNLTTFSLDVKQKKTALSNRFEPLDGLTSVKNRSNQPLGLPSAYKLGFTVDQDEEGYVVSGDDGGGEFITGAIEDNIIEQKSTFSYNWFKAITKTETAGDVILNLPVISKAEVWTNAIPYGSAMLKRYNDQAVRFWYFDGLLNSGGATFTFNGDDLQLARVTGAIGGSILNYKNQPATILDNFFTILVDGGSDYTLVEGYLTPLQYQALDGSVYAQFNGDLYYVAELSGYDPAGKNKTQIKLIRKL